MVAGPGCKLDELFNTSKDIYRETFNIGERERGPDKAIKTAWQRGMAQYFRRHPEKGQRIDHRIAELSFEVWPETKPPFDEEADAYYEAMYDEADRYRSNSANYKEWLLLRPSKNNIV
jgi:hypothetical protein